MKYACSIVALLLSPMLSADEQTAAPDWERKAAADFLSRYERADDENLNAENEYALMRWRDDDPADAAAAQEYVYQNTRVLREEQQREARLQALSDDQRKRDYETAARASRHYAETAQADGQWTMAERIEYDRLYAEEMALVEDFTPEEEAQIARHDEVRGNVLAEIAATATNAVGGVGGEAEYFRRKSDDTNYDASGFQRVPGEYNPFGDEDINLTFTGEMYTHLHEDITSKRELMIRSESLMLGAELYLQRDDLTVEERNIGHDVLNSAEQVYEAARWGRQADFVLVGTGAFADVLLLGLGGPAEKLASKGIAGTKTLFGHIKNFFIGAGDEVVGEVAEGVGRGLSAEGAAGASRELGQSYFDDVANRGAAKARELGLPAEQIDNLVARATNPAPGTTAINRASKHLSVKTLEILANLDNFIAQAVERGVPKSVIDDIMARAAADGGVDAVIFGARNEIAMEIVRANNGAVIIDDFVHAGVEGADGIGPSYAREAFDDVLGSTGKSHPTTPLDARTLRDLTSEFAETGSFGTLTRDEHRVLTQIFDMAQTGVESIYRFDPLENALIKVADADFVKAATELIDTVGDDFGRLADELTAPAGGANNAAGSLTAETLPPPRPKSPGQIQDDIPTMISGGDTVPPPSTPGRSAAPLADDTPTVILGDEFPTLIESSSGTPGAGATGAGRPSALAEEGRKALETAGAAVGSALTGESGPPSQSPETGSDDIDLDDFIAAEGMPLPPGLDDTDDGETDLSEFDVGDASASEADNAAAASGADAEDLDDFIAAHGLPLPPGLDDEDDGGTDLSEFDFDGVPGAAPFESGERRDATGGPTSIVEVATSSSGSGSGMSGSGSGSGVSGSGSGSGMSGSGSDSGMSGSGSGSGMSGSGSDSGMSGSGSGSGMSGSGSGSGMSGSGSGSGMSGSGSGSGMSGGGMSGGGSSGGPSTGLAAAGDAVFYSGMYEFSGNQREMSEGFVADGTTANTFTTNASGELTMHEHMNSLEGSCYPNCAFTATPSTTYEDVGVSTTHGARWGVVLPPFSLAHPGFTGTPLVNENGPLAYVTVQDLAPRSALPGTGVGIFNNVVGGAPPRHPLFGTGSLDNFSMTVDFPTNQITNIAISGNFGPSRIFAVTEDSSAPFPIRANGSFIGFVQGSTADFGILRGAVPGGFASGGDAAVATYGLANSPPSPGGHAITGSVVVER